MGIDRKTAIEALFKKGFTLSGATYSKQPKSALKAQSRKDTHESKDCHQSKVPSPKPKRYSKKALDRAARRAEESLHRTTVRITGYRARPLDCDNFAGSCKNIIDGLRHAGLLSGDEPWKIRLITDQVKVFSYDEEYLEIEIEYP